MLLPVTGVGDQIHSALLDVMAWCDSIGFFNILRCQFTVDVHRKILHNITIKFRKWLVLKKKMSPSEKVIYSTVTSSDNHKESMVMVSWYKFSCQTDQPFSLYAKVMSSGLRQWTTDPWIDYLQLHTDPLKWLHCIRVKVMMYSGCSLTIPSVTKIEDSILL